MPERRYERHVREVDFIKRHVFPGSNIPSVGALVSAAGRASDLDLRHLEDFTPHYARTLAAWRGNLEARAAEVARITDERFRRLWRFYLCLCEGGFAERAIGVAQLLLARPGAR
jgi:cyclopropane-fatty-acyl-phospholipid synthase